MGPDGRARRRVAADALSVPVAPSGALAPDSAAADLMRGAGDKRNILVVFDDRFDGRCEGGDDAVEW